MLKAARRGNFISRKQSFETAVTDGFYMQKEECKCEKMPIFALTFIGPCQCRTFTTISDYYRLSGGGKMLEMEEETFAKMLPSIIVTLPAKWPNPYF